MTAWTDRMQYQLSKVRTWRAVRRLLSRYPPHAPITRWLQSRATFKNGVFDLSPYQPADIVEAIPNLTRDEYNMWKWRNRDAFHIVFRNRVLRSLRWRRWKAQRVPEEDRFGHAVVMAVREGNCWPLFSLSPSFGTFYDGLMTFSDYSNWVKRAVQAGSSRIRNKAFAWNIVANELPSLQRGFLRPELEDHEVENVLQLPPARVMNCLHPDCDSKFEGETPEETQQRVVEHYMRDHPDVMPDRPHQ